MSSSDQLRAKLAPLAAELDASVEHALTLLREARQQAKRVDAGERGVGWMQCADQMLAALRPAQEAHERFRAWCRLVMDAEVDNCGLTVQEREAVFGPRHAESPPK